IEVLKRRAASAEFVFRIKLGKDLAPVFSFSNPRRVDLPPPISEPPTQSEVRLTGQRTRAGLGLANPSEGSTPNWLRGENGVYYRIVGAHQGYPLYETRE